MSILGHNSGSDFIANEVDTPYSYESGIPYYSGHRWDSYGPNISLDFFFGNAGWWHGNDFRGGYTYDRGTRFYNDGRNGRAVRGDDGYREGGRFDRQAAPVQQRFSQSRGYEGARQGGNAQDAPRAAAGRQSGGHEAARDGGHGEDRNDRGGHAH